MKYHMETEKAIIQNNKKQRIFELLKHKYSLFFLSIYIQTTINIKRKNS